jgi:hypothetical protein
MVAPYGMDGSRLWDQGVVDMGLQVPVCGALGIWIWGNGSRLWGIEAAASW